MWDIVERYALPFKGWIWIDRDAYKSNVVYNLEDTLFWKTAEVSNKNSLRDIYQMLLRDIYDLMELTKENVARDREVIICDYFIQSMLGRPSVINKTGFKNVRRIA